MDINYYKQMEPLFGVWHIVRLIGEGTASQVYEIERKEFGHVYKAAMKTISIPKSQDDVKNVMMNGMDRASTEKYFEEIVDCMTKEFALMDKVKGNSNIVSYADHRILKKKEGIGWDILIRMEYLKPFSKYLEEKEKGMNRNEVIRLGIDICRALEVCEHQHIIHRDIKPDNLFISDNNDFKLGDFGMARTLDKTTEASTQVGAKVYAAPEVMLGEKYSRTVDYYSLGLVLYRLLNHNRLPFFPSYPERITYSDMEKARKRRFKGEMIPDIPDQPIEINNILKKACAYKAEDRYQSASQMRQDLEKIYTLNEEKSIPGSQDALHDHCGNAVAHAFETMSEESILETEDYETKTKRLINSFQESDEKQTVEFLNRILTIADDMELGLGSVPSSLKDELFFRGMDMTYSHLISILEKIGVTQINSVGKEFDPYYHYAIEMVTSDIYPSGTVVRELSKGYLYQDKVLRYTKVAVAK